MSRPNAPAWGAQPAAALTVALIAICAPLYAVLTFERDFAMNATRSLALPVIAIEWFIIALTWIGGFRLLRAVKAMPRIVVFPLFIWLANALIAAVFAENKTTALVFLSFSVTHALLTIALWERLRADWKNYAEPFILTLTGSLVAFVLVCHLFEFLVSADPEFNWMAFGAGVVNVRHLGFYAVSLAGLGIGMVAATRLRSNWLIGAICAGIGFYFVAWTGGRSPFLAVIIGLSIVIGFMGPESRTKVAGALVAIAVLAMPISLATAPPASGYGLESIVGRATPEAEIDSPSVGRRFDFWQKTALLVLERPLIGHGQHNWTGRVASSEGQNAHPHNLVLQVLYDWGAIGALALIALGILALRRVPGWVAARRDLALPAIGALVCLLAMSMADGPFFFNFPQFVAAICVAILASIRTDQNAVT